MMRDEHIISVLDEGPLSNLSEERLEAVRAHAARCDSCARALEAARVSTLLLRERADASFEPSPFFQTRVMAALRERRDAAKEAWSLARLWKATGALVSSMALTVAALAVFTFVAPPAPTGEATQDVASASDTYSEEELLFSAGAAYDEEMTNEQLLTTIYGSDDEGAR